jgi:hypothetical protein
VAVPGSVRMRPARLGRNTGMTVIDVVRGAEPVPASGATGDSRVARTVAALPGSRSDEGKQVP